MARLRLRTQLFVASLVIICALLGSLLVVVHYLVRSEIAEGVRQRADASLHAFESVQRERELELSRTAAMLAELPTLKAVLATQHALTIQDASEPFWKLAGSQLFVLSSPDGHVFGFHMSEAGWDANLAEADLKKSIEQGDGASWCMATIASIGCFCTPYSRAAEVISAKSASSLSAIRLIRWSRRNCRWRRAAKSP